MKACGVVPVVVVDAVVAGIICGAMSTGLSAVVVVEGVEPPPPPQLVSPVVGAVADADDDCACD